MSILGKRTRSETKASEAKEEGDEKGPKEAKKEEIKHTLLWLRPTGRCVVRTTETLVTKYGHANQLHYEDAMRDRIVKMVDAKDRNRFVFWRTPKNCKVSAKSDELPSEAAKLFAQDAKIEKRTADYAGVDMLRLLTRTSSCKDCGEHIVTNDKTLRILPAHVFRILMHLHETVEVLRGMDMVHGDLSPANLLIQPTEAEWKTGALSESLPKLIDFGLANVRDKGVSPNHTPSILVDCLSSCRHGMRPLQRVRHRWPKDEWCWLAEAATEHGELVHAILLQLETCHSDKTIWHMFNRARSLLQMFGPSGTGP